MEISLTSFGSSQILPRPHLSTDEARRFWRRSDTICTGGATLSLTVLGSKGVLDLAMPPLRVDGNDSC